MLNLAHTRVQLARHFEVATGEAIAEEGQALIIVNDSGVGRVKPATGAGSEVFAGVAHSHTLLPTLLPYVGTVTAVGTVLTLPFTPVSGQIRLLDAAQVLAAGNPGTTANEYSISGNVVTLHSGQSGKAITVSLLYTPTVTQAISLMGEGMIGAQADKQIQGDIGVITQGRVATTCFNVDGAWTAGATVKTAANGRFTQSGSGTTLANAIVAQVPTADAPYLVLDLL